MLDVASYTGVMSSTDPRTRAHRAWLRAYHAMDAEPTEASIAAEQQAWEAYVEVCNEMGQCIHHGCTTLSPDHVYCEEHRPK